MNCGTMYPHLFHSTVHKKRSIVSSIIKLNFSKNKTTPSVGELYKAKKYICKWTLQSQKIQNVLLNIFLMKNDESKNIFVYISYKPTRYINIFSNKLYLGPFSSSPSKPYQRGDLKTIFLSRYLKINLRGSSSNNGLQKTFL